MAAVVKIDGFDFYNYLRVAPGEGLDPAGSGFREPQFGDATGKDAQPLISVTEQTKEMTWPLHLNAASKDALHSLLTDVNRRLAEAKVLEWKDENATNSTYFTIQFARFDPDYNFRRAQKSWLSGVLRVWVSPYGSTGTYRTFAFTGSAPSYGLPIICTAPSPILGDTPALSRYTLEQGLLNATATRGMYGVSVVPTRSIHFWRGASLSLNPADWTSLQATIVSATTGIGSQTCLSYINGGVSWRHVGQLNMSAENLSYSNGSYLAAGRHRLVAIARARATVAACSGIALTAVNFPTAPITSETAYGPTQVISPSTNWRVVDLGIYTHLHPTQGIPNFINIRAGMLGASAGSATGPVEVTGLYFLPENDTVLSTGEVTNGKVNFIFREDANFVGDSEIGAIPMSNIVGQVPRIPVGTQSKLLFFAHNDADDQHVTISNTVSYADVQERFSYSR